MAKRGAPYGNKNAEKEGLHRIAIRLSFDGDILDQYFDSLGIAPSEEEAQRLLKELGYHLFNEHFRRRIEQHEAIIL